MSSRQHWTHYFYQLIGKEISRFSKYYDRVVLWKPVGSDQLLSHIECKDKKELSNTFPDLKNEREQRTLVLLSGTLNYDLDIQGLFEELKPQLSRTSRITAVLYNPYFRWIYKVANFLGLRKAANPTTFITNTDLKNLAHLADYEVIYSRPAAYFPFKLYGLGSLINYLFPLFPILKHLSFVTIALLRPKIKELQKPSLSIVIPARNEMGNIENALKRMPNLGCKLEIIFVEGHSQDGTWAEIQRVLKIYSNQFKLKAVQQTGKGKNDAVRLGFSIAEHDLLTILDADLTMPPELLGRFYSAYCNGQADFINGTRLIYPMEGDAMKFLNQLGNIFFAKSLSWVLDSKIGDSLCGTKLVARHDYERFIKWRNDFGDFDPFGDFELLFPAAILGLHIIDIPIRYRARTYGTTNIHRFRHGFMLLKMTFIGFFRIKTGKV